MWVISTWDSFLFEDEVPDIEVFKAQAQRYGFNEDEYLVALNKVPRWSREQVNTAMTFYSKFASIFGELSYSNLNLTKMLIKSKTVGEALRESEERFRNVFEQGPIGIAIIGLDYRWVAVNAKVSEIVGYTKDELTKLTFVDITHPDDIDKDVEYAEQLSRGEIPYYSMEKRYIKKNGEVVWINLTATMIHDDHDKELYYLSMIGDITESKRWKISFDRVKSGIVPLWRIVLTVYLSKRGPRSSLPIPVFTRCWVILLENWKAWTTG